MLAAVCIGTSAHSLSSLNAFADHISKNKGHKKFGIYNCQRKCFCISENSDNEFWSMKTYDLHLVDRTIHNVFKPYVSEGAGLLLGFILLVRGRFYICIYPF